MNRKFLFAPLSLALALSSLRGQIHPPRLAVASLRDGSVHPVYGLPGSLVVAPAFLSGAQRIAFSDHFGLLSNASSLSLVSAEGSLLGRFDMDETQPVLGIGDAVESAIAWLPSRSAVVHWNGAGFTLVNVSSAGFTGVVTAVSKGHGDTAELLLVSPEAGIRKVEVSLQTGASKTVFEMPAAHVTTGAELDHAVVLIDNHLLKIFRENDATTVFEYSLPDLNISIALSSSHSLQISAADGRNWILSSSNNRYEISELPGSGAVK